MDAALPLTPGTSDAQRTVRSGTQGRQTLEAPIRKVIVFEDRAQIERSGALELEAGACRVTLPVLTPLAVDRSLQVLASVPGVLVADVKLVRCAVLEHAVLEHAVLEQGSVETRGTAEQQEALDQSLLALSHQLNRLDTRIRLLELRRADLKLRWAGAVPRGVMPEPFFQRMEALEADLAQAQDEKQRLQWQQADLFEQRTALQAFLTASGHVKSGYSARLELLLDVREACACHLVIRYAVACALWRPEHEARLLGTGGNARLRVASRAVVWQRTGEDWRGVELYCSTARPGRASSAPLLQDDLLHVQRKSDPKTVVAEMREEEIQTTGLGGAPTTSSAMPGVDDGGEALSWAAEGRLDVPSTGRPVRARLFALESEAKLSLVSFPEKAQQVLLRALATNTSSRPLLAGPVLLYRESGYVGRSKLGFIAPGERLALSFGSHDALLLQRESVVKREETRLTGYQTVSVTLTHYISNLSALAQVFEVTERVPVSELEDVRVSLAEGAPGKPDGEGLVTWNVQVKPHEQLKQTLTFRLEAPARVVLPY